MLAPPRDRDDSPDFKTQSMASTGIRKGFTMSAGIRCDRAIEDGGVFFLLLLLIHSFSSRIYSGIIICRFSNFVSSCTTLACGDPDILTPCHPSSVSYSCHFSWRTRSDCKNAVLACLDQTKRSGSSASSFRHCDRGASRPCRAIPSGIRLQTAKCTLFGPDRERGVHEASC